MKGMVFIDEIQESVNSSSWLLEEVGAGNGVVETTMCRSNGSKNSYRIYPVEKELLWDTYSLLKFYNPPFPKCFYLSDELERGYRHYII